MEQQRVDHGARDILVDMDHNGEAYGVPMAEWEYGAVVADAEAVNR